MRQVATVPNSKHLFNREITRSGLCFPAAQPTSRDSFRIENKASEPEDVLIRELKNILDKNLPDEQFALPELCRAIGMSRSKLFRKLKALIDIAPSDFIRSYRLHRAKYLLEHTDLLVADVAYEVGYKDPAYFSNSFFKAFGVTPSSVR